MTVLKVIKYFPFLDTVDSLVRNVPRVQLSSLKAGDFFMCLDPNLGSFEFHEFKGTTKAGTWSVFEPKRWIAEKYGVELVYADTYGVNVWEGCKFIEDRPVWLLPELVKNNIQDLQRLLKNFYENQIEEVLQIREMLDTLGWTYEIGMHRVTGDAYIVYRDGNVPEDAVHKNTPLGMLTDRTIIKQTVKYLEKCIQAMQPANAQSA